MNNLKFFSQFNVRLEATSTVNETTTIEAAAAVAVRLIFSSVQTISLVEEPLPIYLPTYERAVRVCCCFAKIIA